MKKNAQCISYSIQYGHAALANDFDIDFCVHKQSKINKEIYIGTKNANKAESL